LEFLFGGERKKGGRKCKKKRCCRVGPPDGAEPRKKELWKKKGFSARHQVSAFLSSKETKEVVPQPRDKGKKSALDTRPLWPGRCQKKESPRREKKKKAVRKKKKHMPPKCNRKLP